MWIHVKKVVLIGLSAAIGAGAPILVVVFSDPTFNPADPAQWRRALIMAGMSALIAVLNLLARLPRDPSQRTRGDDPLT